jgi:TonB family protein
VAGAPGRPWAPRATWCLAALGAVLIHAGCAALALEYLGPEDDAAEELGAPAIEVGLDLLAPQREDLDLPPGPDSEAQAASAVVAEQKAAVEETPLPKAVPEVTDDPERAVTQSEATKPEDDTRTAAVDTAASTASAAAQATALPSPATAAPSPRSAAPAQGSGDSLRRVVTTWQKALAAHLKKYQHYPDNRQNRSLETVVSIVLDRSGNVVSASIATSSGDGAFDDAALAAIRRANPVPAPPPPVADAVPDMTFTLPLRFNRESDVREAHRK